MKGRKDNAQHPNKQVPVAKKPMPMKKGGMARKGC